MPTDDIDTMSGPELSAAVARDVMGWEYEPGVARAGWMCGSPAKYQMPSGEWMPAKEWNSRFDRNNAYRVLMRCEELGIVPNLCTWIVRASEITMFTLLTIDPKIICRAALRAVRGAK